MLDVLAYCHDVRVWTPGVRYAAELAVPLDVSVGTGESWHAAAH